VLGFAPLAHADPRLDELSKRATAQYQAGDYSGAVSTLLQCYDLQHDPRFLYNIARAYEKAHQPVDAARFYHAYLDQLDTEATLVARAKEALERLEPKPGTDSETRLPPVVPFEPPAPNGAPPAAGPTAPAPAGTAPVTPAPVTAAPVTPPAGAVPPVKPPAALEPPPPPHAGAPPEPARSYTGVYVVIGAGAAVGLTGLGFALWANQTASEMHASLDPVEKPKLRTDALNRAIVADTLMGVGVATAATGLILRIALPGTSARVGVSVGAKSLAVTVPLRGF
jgi:hypothetical protein